MNPIPYVLLTAIGDYVSVRVNEFLTLTEAAFAIMRIDAVEPRRTRDQLQCNFTLLRSKLLTSIC